MVGTMNALRTCIVSLVLLLMAHGTKALAVPPTYYGVNLSASLSTETLSGTTYAIHTQHINNRTIAGALFSTGTTGAAKESDLVLVFDTGVNLSVINTSSTNDAVIDVLATSGTNAVRNGVGSASKSDLLLTEIASDYEFTLPQVSGTQVTNYKLSAKVNLSNADVAKLFLTFSGGEGTITAGATVFQGTMRQTGKVYP